MPRALKALAGGLPAEDLQLYYQVALTGQGDLPLAPDPRAGFEMVLLRALAFRPGADRDAPRRTSAPRPSSLSETARRRCGCLAGVRAGALTGVDARPVPIHAIARACVGPAAAASVPALAGAARAVALASHADWLALVDRLELGGIASQIAHHCDLKGWEDGRLSLGLDPAAEHLRSPGAESRLHAALEKTMGTAVKLDIQVARPQRETLAREARARVRRASAGGGLRDGGGPGCARDAGRAGRELDRRQHRADGLSARRPCRARRCGGSVSTSVFVMPDLRAEADLDPCRTATDL